MKFVVVAAVCMALTGLIPGTVSQPGVLQVAKAASDPVIAAAGDISCDPASTSYNGGLGTATRCRQKYTSDLLVNSGLAAILDLGDNQYFCGGYQAFLSAYDPTWGRVKSITHPSLGNHEYLTSGGTGCDITNEGAAGYFNYFGSAAGTAGQGYYSFDVGAWHIIALNSNCTDAGGCTVTSPQYKWLQADLAAHNAYCTLAYWHIPYFSSGTNAAPNMGHIWQLLYDNDADLILNGHDHIYERFAPQNPQAVADPARGIRQFTVGTGGAEHTSISVVAANSEVRNSDTFGVLKLTLHATGYSWQFVHESGATFNDSGSGNCHGSNPPTATPTATAGAPTATRTPTPTPTSGTGQSMTFLPQADAYVHSGSPTTNFGTLTSLRADASPDIHSYVRFGISGLNGASITRARLQVFMSSGSNSTLKALAVSDITWGESSINYSNAPALGATIATSGTLTTGTWVTLDVTPYFTGPGTYSLGLITPGSTAVSFGSRESGSTAPQLILDLGGGATATATPQPTATPTQAVQPTNTPTPTQAVATSTPTATPTPGAGQSATFVPAADAYVNSSSPTTNYGTLTSLRADGSPDIHSYVRFAVSGLGGKAITRARLSFYMNSGSSSGMKALAVADNTWGETGVNYSNAPALGGTIATSGALTTGTWVTLDVTSYVAAEGTYNFGVITPGSTAISFAAREAGANAPQLILDLGP